MARLSRFVVILVFFITTPRLCAQDLQKIGHLSYAPVTLAGCWHHVDSSGGEWALVGTSVGLSLVDVNDPTQPVERFSVPGITNNWREVRSWAGFAYVGSEAPGSGITIVDLRELPNTIQWKVWRGDGIYDSLVIKSHALQAVDGYLYVFGGASITNGALIAELSDPWNPVIVGKYSTLYVHDGYIRGDTMWTSEIYQGQFSVVDIADKANPVLLATQPTPGAFNHNTMLSGDGKILFTADESLGAPLCAFDVSNLDNITLLDTYNPSRKPEGEVHNVRVINDFLVCPSYRGQLTLVDASRPQNLIETAWDSLGNSLVWDADPYLPSGIILATAKSEGLYVYKKPSYKHASWLEGKVLNASTGNILSKATVFLLATPNSDKSKGDGTYKTGSAAPGIYSVYAFREGFYPTTIAGIELKTNEVTYLDIPLSPIPAGQHNAENNSINVFPSPFDDYITLIFSEYSPFSGTETSCQLFDHTGRLLAKSAPDLPTQVVIQDLKHLPAGVYYLKVQNEQGFIKGFKLMK
jgi:choice-of-anchor B domain-containing protein